MRFVVRFLLLLSVLFLLDRHTAYADTLLLTNGDTLTGVVVRLEKGSLTFRSAKSGVVTVKVGDIRSLTTDGVVVLELKDDRVFKAQLIAAEAGQFTAKSAEVSAPFSLPLTEIQAIICGSGPDAAEARTSKIALRFSIEVADTSGYARYASLLP